MSLRKIDRLSVQGQQEKCRLLQHRNVEPPHGPTCSAGVVFLERTSLSHGTIATRRRPGRWTESDPFFVSARRARPCHAGPAAGSRSSSVIVEEGDPVRDRRPSSAVARQGDAFPRISSACPGPKPFGSSAALVGVQLVRSAPRATAPTRVDMRASGERAEGRRARPLIGRSAHRPGVQHAGRWNSPRLSSSITSAGRLLP